MTAEYVFHPRCPGVLDMQRAALAELARLPRVARALARAVRSTDADGSVHITGISNRHAAAILSLELFDSGYAVGQRCGKLCGDGLYSIVARKI